MYIEVRVDCRFLLFFGFGLSVSASPHCSAYYNGSFALSIGPHKYDLYATNYARVTLSRGRGQMC